MNSAGDLLVATGNSFNISTFDVGESVIRLSPDLRPVDFFAPANWADLNAADLDLGSTGPLLLEGGLVFQVGKDGIGYLLREDHLGGIGGEAFRAPACLGGGAFGASASSPQGVFVPCTNGLVALRLGPGASFRVAWRGPEVPAGPPIVTGDLVWTVDITAGILYALDARTGHVLQRLPVGPVTHFATPTASGGRIFVVGSARLIAFSGT